ncbi:MAG: hypothetical protein IPI07_10155 [Flavobacteriales bacterium]|nr:hypothetical protein [Flavobacteriales bacterium]
MASFLVQELSGDIPERAKNFLQQAIDSKGGPSGCVMLCASAVDAMLKAKKNYVEGNLYSRIDKAVLENDYLIWPNGPMTFGLTPMMNVMPITLRRCLH